MKGVSRYSAVKVHAALADECRRRGIDPSLKNIARLVGASPRSVARWRTGEQRSVSLDVADRAEEETSVHVSHFEHEAAP